MSRIKNKRSGVVHAEGTYIFSAVCGAIPYEFTTLPDNTAVTCKRCLRILKERKKENKRICKYPNCYYHSSAAKTYCCAACSADAYDDERLEKEELEMEKLRAKIVKDLKERIKSHRSNFPIKLEKKALESLLPFVENHASVYETTSLSTILTEILKEYTAYLRESLF